MKIIGSQTKIGRGSATRAGTWIVLCAAVWATVPTLHAQKYSDGVKWLDSHSDPPTINVSGTWVGSSWKTVVLRQKEGSNAVSGTASYTNIHGVVSGNQLYLLFVYIGHIDYSAVLTLENEKTLKGSYTRRLMNDESGGRRMLLTYSGPVPAMPANYKAKSTRTIEVAPFEVQDGVDFGAKYQVALADEVVNQLIGTRRFTQVTRTEDLVPGAQPPDIRVSGVITELSEGARALRLFVGFGAGMARIRAHVKFIDVATGEVKLEQDVEGQLIKGMAGGDAVEAAYGLAKEIAKLAKDKGLR